MESQQYMWECKKCQNRDIRVLIWMGINNTQTYIYQAVKSNPKRGLCDHVAVLIQTQILYKKQF